jgi:hypothetical protein
MTLALMRLVPTRVQTQMIQAVQNLVQQMRSVQTKAELSCLGHPNLLVQTTAVQNWLEALRRVAEKKRFQNEKGPQNCLVQQKTQVGLTRLVQTTVLQS